MKRVLIIGPKFFYFNSCIEKAFQHEGYTTRVVSYDHPIHPYDRLNKIRYKLSRDKLGLKQVSRERYSSYIKGAFDIFQPELVFLINSDNLTEEVVRYFHTKARVAIWLFDSITHFPWVEENIGDADAVFCYEKSDIALIQRKVGITAHFLPQAVDMDMYYPIANCEKKYDIVFAGDLWQSPKRQHIVQKVVQHLGHTHTIRIYGIYKPWYKGLWKCLTRERRDIYTNCNVTSTELNRVYNEARVVINIHNEQQHDGANPKVYEIAATGTTQVCDCNPYIETLFKDNQIYLYQSEEDVIATIEEALRFPRKVSVDWVKHNTFDERIGEVLQILNGKREET